MIYITGDCHADFSRFTKKQRRKLSFELTEKDFVIICGDFGLCWADDRTFMYHCDWLGRLPFTILWVQGNHENYDMLQNFPIEIYNGGKVRHIVRDKVILLERGQIFQLENKTFFTFGGASSHDVQGGILNRQDPLYNEKRKRAVRLDIPYRVEHLSWWKEELPTNEEMQEGLHNLQKAGYKVDYIISHCGSDRIQNMMEKQSAGINGKKVYYPSDILTQYFEKIEDMVHYKQWYFGHYHLQKFVDDRHMVVYKSIVPYDCYCKILN